MSLALVLPMSAFALAASISPGPVNMVCLGSGARYGVRASLAFVSGATAGFILLFVASGLGLAAMLHTLPALADALKWGGVAFLLYLSARLALDDGRVSAEAAASPPGFMAGALMQWLNPKAWLAALSGISAYTSAASHGELTLFTALYAPICWLSLACWCYGGAFLGRQFGRAANLRRLNRTLAALLAGSCVFLLLA